MVEPTAHEYALVDPICDAACCAAEDPEASSNGADAVSVPRSAGSETVGHKPGSLRVRAGQSVRQDHFGIGRLSEDEEVLDFPSMDSESPEYGSVQAHYLFACLGQDEFDGLMAHVTRIGLEKGEVLFHRGDIANHFYYVDTGQLELSLIAATGQKKVLEVLGPGRTFAEAVAFMREHKFPVTCEALSDAILCQIPSRDYINIIYSNPVACMRLLSGISRYLHAHVREIERLTIQNARSRLASYLLDHVVDANDDEATVRLELPRHVIASRLSIMPETLSRLLRNMVDEGILTIEDRVIFVHSLARLRPYD